VRPINYSNSATGAGFQKQKLVGIRARPAIHHQCHSYLHIAKHLSSVRQDLSFVNHVLSFAHGFPLKYNFIGSNRLLDDDILVE
jgi:hypothetical protein